MHTSGLKTWNRILVFLRCFWTVWICDCSTCSCTGPQHRCYTTVQHRNIQSVRVAALPELILSLLEILFERGNKNQKKTKSQTRFVWHTATPRQRLVTTCLFLRPHDRADHNVYKIVPLCFMVTLSQSFNWTLVCAAGSVWVLTGHAGLQQQRREKRSQSFTWGAFSAEGWRGGGDEDRREVNSTTVDLR